MVCILVQSDKKGYADHYINETKQGLYFMPEPVNS